MTTAHFNQCYLLPVWVTETNETSYCFTLAAHHTQFISLGQRAPEVHHNYQQRCRVRALASLSLLTWRFPGGSLPVFSANSKLLTPFLFLWLCKMVKDKVSQSGLPVLIITRWLITWTDCNKSRIFANSRACGHIWAALALLVVSSFFSSCNHVFVEPLLPSLFLLSRLRHMHLTNHCARNGINWATLSRKLLWAFFFFFYKITYPPTRDKGITECFCTGFLNSLCQA